MPPGGQLVLGRTIAGAEWRRPLSRNWSGTFGLTWQQTNCMDEQGQSIRQVRARRRLFCVP